MEDNQLVKEIVTTTTERYGDNGKVKEKVTESREKIYSTAFSEEQIKKAKPAEEGKKVGENPTPSSPKPEIKTQEDKIKEAAAALDAKKNETVYDAAKATTPNPFENMPKPQDNPYLAWQQQQQAPPPNVPQYNVANRGSQPSDPTKFPWEKS